MGVRERLGQPWRSGTVAPARRSQAARARAWQLRLARALKPRLSALRREAAASHVANTRGGTDLPLSGERRRFTIGRRFINVGAIVPMLRGAMLLSCPEPPRDLYSSSHDRKEPQLQRSAGDRRRADRIRCARRDLRSLSVCPCLGSDLRRSGRSTSDVTAARPYRQSAFERSDWRAVY